MANSVDRDQTPLMHAASDLDLCCLLRYIGSNNSGKCDIYSRLSLSRIPRDSLKYFLISIPRHIRFAELGKTNSINHI